MFFYHSPACIVECESEYKFLIKKNTQNKNSKKTKSKRNKRSKEKIGGKTNEMRLRISSVYF